MLRRRDMRNRVVLSAVVVLALAGCGKESLPKLPASAAGDERAAADVASLSMPAEPIVYRVEGDLPDLPDKAPAYRLEHEDVEAAVAETAAALGIDGEIRKRGDSWVVGQEGRELVVHDDPGLSWYVGPSSDCAVSSDGTESCAVRAEAVARDTEPLDEAGMARARQMFDRLGVRGEPTVDGTTASVRPVVDGLPTVGYEFGLAIGPGGEVVGGHGRLGRPERLGDYPLIDVEAALERLETGFAVGPRTLMAEDAPAVVEAVLTDVELVLQLVEGHLVPAFRFSTAEGEGPTVVAVVERLLEDLAPQPQPQPQPAPDPGVGQTCSGSGGGASGADPDNPPDQPMSVEICGPSTAEVGEEVVFDVTVADADAEIIESGCGGPKAQYGDEGEGVVVGDCMPACAAPLQEGRPGKFARQFRHTYEKPGTYAARFTFQSAFCTKGSSRGEGTHTVVVK